MGKHSSRYLAAKYYSLFFKTILPQAFFGAVVKRYKVVFFLKPSFLHFFFFFLKYHSLFTGSSLLDVFAVDHPENKKNRFLVTYYLWSGLSNIRFFLRCPTNAYAPLLSAKSFFPSAGWLEREV